MRVTPVERLFIFVPIALASALLLALVAVVNHGQTRLLAATQEVSEAQERQAMISDLMQKIFDAEAAQRGFLLTQNSRYLKFLDPAVEHIEPTLDRLVDSYNSSGRRSALPELRRLRNSVAMKIGEIRTSLRLYGEQGLPAALALINTDFGKKTTDAIRDSVTNLRENERLSIVAATAGWERNQRIVRGTVIGAISMSIALLLLVGLLFARDLNRRAQHASDLVERNRALDVLVQDRTRTLSELSSHLQQLTEKERRTLARELHDELGGLLVAMKMDLVWLRRKLANADPQIAARWDRTIKAIDHGLEFKRRIIESLRPTLLDNLGLVPALHWLIEEACRPASLEYRETYPEQLPELSNDANIALFRIVQESLTNILQHARATQVDILMSSTGDALLLTVTDNGIGIPLERINAPGSHGLTGMRQRVFALGGDVIVRQASAGGGTIVQVRLPVSPPTHKLTNSLGTV